MHSLLYLQRPYDTGRIPLCFTANTGAQSLNDLPRVRQQNQRASQVWETQVGVTHEPHSWPCLLSMLNFLHCLTSSTSRRATCLSIAGSPNNGARVAITQCQLQPACEACACPWKLPTTVSGIKPATIQIKLHKLRIKLFFKVEVLKTHHSQIILFTLPASVFKVIYIYYNSMVETVTI